MTDADREARASTAVGDLYHHYFSGLILTLVTRKDTATAAEWIFRLFRHQHHERFLASFDKLGLRGMPHAVAAAAYHYLSNKVGGVDVEFIRESDRKAWVNFVPPRWIYPDATICGVPSEVSRAMLRGWYAQNGVSLGNPRLGFVCTAQTMDGQHGLAGYFLEHERELAPEQRLRFSPGELPPPFDPRKAPELDPAVWTPERLTKARRTYAMTYIRTGLPRLVELLGPAEAAAYGRIAAHLIGAQFALRLANACGVVDRSPGGCARVLHRIAEIEGDTAEIVSDGDELLVHRQGWRLMRGLTPILPGVFESWNGLFEGAVSVIDRAAVLEVLARPDFGDDRITWRIRRRA
jgi:hypothetical protein